MIGYHTKLNPAITLTPIDSHKVKSLFLKIWGAMTFTDISSFAPALVKSQRLETPEGVAAFWLVAQVFGQTDELGDFENIGLDPLEAWAVALEYDTVLRDAETHTQYSV